MTAFLLVHSPLVGPSTWTPTADGLSAGGHSGAGAFLPAIGARLGDRLGGLVFVDAVLPATQGAHEAPPSQRDLLDQKTVDGELRRWLEWWPDEVAREHVPDADQRAALLAEMPRLPRSFYDEAVPLPDGWSDGHCAYVRLSDAYAEEHDVAQRRGWPSVAIDADHLAIATRPDHVAAELLELAIA